MKLKTRNSECVDTTRAGLVVSICEVGVVLFITAFFIPVSRALLILLIKWMFCR